MKTTFVFVGSAPSHMAGVVSFRTFGQAVELTEEQAKDLSVGGSSLNRGETFASLGFAPTELLKWGLFGALPNAPAEFTEKRMLAVAAAEKLRAEFEGAAAPVEGE